MPNLARLVYGKRDPEATIRDARARVEREFVQADKDARLTMDQLGNQLGIKTFNARQGKAGYVIRVPRIPRRGKKSAWVLRVR